MPKLSAGLLLFRRAGSGLEVLLAHPGGPFWARKDLGAWSIPKGERDEDEESGETARREFREETGQEPPPEPWLGLGEVVQPGGKRVTGFAAEGAFDPSALVSATFEMAWPPRSGRRASFPEVDRVAWFTIHEARRRILAGQVPFVDRLAERLGASRDPAS